MTYSYLRETRKVPSRVSRPGPPNRAHMTMRGLPSTSAALVKVEPKSTQTTVPVAAAGATAVVLNVTGVEATRTTDLRVYPTPADGAVPLVSNVNLNPRQTAADLSVARIGGYDLATMTCDAPDTGDLAANDLHNWITSLQSNQSLGASACGQIVCGSLACDIKVQWDDSRGTSANATDATAAATHTVETQTRL